MKPAAIEKTLIEELARVFWDPDDAVTFLWHAGFPAQSMPTFKNPRSFWARAVREIANGAVVGGMATLVDAATARYPSNRVFERCASSVRSAHLRHAKALPRSTTNGGWLRAGWRAVRKWSPWTMAALRRVWT